MWLGDSVRAWVLPERADVIVGRALEADVQIASSAVSRRHAQLSTHGNAVVISDLGSQNGTRVNGERVSSERSLAYGDIISFGDVTAAFTQDVEGKAQPQGGAGIGAGPLPRIIEIDGRSVLVGDTSMLQVFEQIALLARSDLSVLILGETGTGKELAATALRHWSRRAEQPFVAINCASLPEAIAESELFGHERGAFSGAVQPKPGLLESAPGGTIFLDEIGDLSLGVQAKLLRVLETHRVTRLGSVQERAIDIRVVAATHRDLAADVRGGRFREDLYYRLTAAVVRLPPLRARSNELAWLAETFLQQAVLGLQRTPLMFSEAGLARLRAHDWPGNVRELKNLVENLAATVVDDVITPDHVEWRLGAAAASEPTPLAAFAVEPRAHAATGDFRPLAAANREFEWRQIENALAATGGNKTQAARLLGVPLRTFMEKIKRHRTTQG